jgi:hypothetical protein
MPRSKRAGRRGQTGADSTHGATASLDELFILRVLCTAIIARRLFVFNAAVTRDRERRSRILPHALLLVGEDDIDG